MRFTLTILPDGRGILTCPDDLTLDQFQRLTQVFEEWQQGHRNFMVLSATDVVQVKSIELDIDDEIVGR